MFIDHVAIWTDDLERLKNYYIKYYKAVSNSKYINKETGFQSYFLSFASGARIEIMSRLDIPQNLNDNIKQHLGIIHLAFGVDSTADVDNLKAILETDGYQILRGPRVTGDGYYEFETIDPDSNRIEVITKV